MWEIDGGWVGRWGMGVRVWEIDGGWEGMGDGCESVGD